MKNVQRLAPKVIRVFCVTKDEVWTRQLDWSELALNGKGREYCKKVLIGK
jgi:hypothetical protein